MRCRQHGQRLHPLGACCGEVPADDATPVVADDVHPVDTGAIGEVDHIIQQLEDSIGIDASGTRSG